MAKDDVFILSDHPDVTAVIFDMDGVLLDNEDAMMSASIQGLSDYGVTAEASDFTQFFGRGTDAYVGGVCKMHGLEYRREIAEHIYDIYDKIAPAEARVFPGVSGVIAGLHAAGYKIAIASSAAGRKVSTNIKVAGILPSTVDCVVTEDDITRNKPDPQIFLKAAEKLEVPIEKCIVCEDSFSGVRAAVAAGALCVGIRGTYSDEILKESGAACIIDGVSRLLLSKSK